MAARDILTIWIEEALKDLGGSATVIEVAKKIWELHEGDLKETDLFYTWQYDYRWAATKLRKDGVLKPSNGNLSGVWELNSK